MNSSAGPTRLDPCQPLSRYDVRSARPEDTEAIKALDGSFTTASVFCVEIAEDGFTLRETPVDPPLTKVFPEDGPDRESDEGSAGQDSPTFVALAADGAVVGVVSVSYAPWCRRLTIEDIEVVPAHRGCGVGSMLLCRAEEFARECGAGHVWLEVTNINAPAIHAYRRMGFALCGLDTSLYAFTPSAGEYALYMSKPCR